MIFPFSLLRIAVLFFTPKNPVTKPTRHKAEKLESRFDFETLIDECIANMESIDVYPSAQEKDSEDIF